jgi:hypothetical protein
VVFSDGTLVDLSGAWLDQNVRFLAIMNEFARNGDRISDGVYRVAAFLDHLHQLLHLLGRSGTLDFKNIGETLPSGRYIGKPEFASGVIVHADIHLRIIDLNVQLWRVPRQLLNIQKPMAAIK